MPEGPAPEDIAGPLLSWYQQHARRLPWRDNPSPYQVWVSEIMLQQTRVDTAIAYFNRWMELFPTIEDLAKSHEQDVLRAWEGLGYYSRARNLHRSARMVMTEYAGQLPSTTEELQKLPGIGRYTAGAIASIAFGRDAPALDGNIRRVLSRVFNVNLPAQSPQGEKILWDLARLSLPTGKAGDFNQAIMDLGSSICTPRSPACLVCPLTEMCQARLSGVQEQRPILASRPTIPHYTVTAAVIQRDDTILIARRPAGGLLAGLWEFPGGKVEKGEDLPQGLRREIEEELGVSIEVGEAIGVFTHAYTHFKVTLHAFYCSLIAGEPKPLEASELRWVKADQLSEFPMGKIDRIIANRLELAN